MKHGRTEEWAKWRKLVSEQIASGQTVAAFCRDRGLRDWQFYDWKKRVLVIVNARDHLVNPQPALDWAAALQAPTYISQGACAHLIMNCDAAAVSARVRAFLSNGALMDRQ